MAKKSCPHKQDHILSFCKAEMGFKKFKMNDKKFENGKIRKIMKKISCALLHMKNLGKFCHGLRSPRNNFHSYSCHFSTKQKWCSFFDKTKNQKVLSQNIFT